MQLLAGQRIILDGDDKFARVLSGKIEVYAITRGKVSYRQFYLMKIGAGEAIFPTMDDFGELAILIYAVEDSELIPAYFAQSEPENLSALMKKWFAGLEKNFVVATFSGSRRRNFNFMATRHDFRK